MAFEHVSVLLHETVDGLNVRPDGTYVDATLGGGGHAFEVCSRLGDKGRFIGIDQDADAIKAASERLAGFGEKVTIIRSNYRDMKPQLQAIGVDKVDGIVLDLGVSSYQLDTAERGFSYRADAPLDMRMDQRQKMTARDIVNGYSEAELYRVIRDYGEDRFAKNIAKHIVAERAKGPVETTGQLNEIIRHAIPMKIQKTSGHPSKRTFQAIRIELNHELDVLRDSLDDMIDIYTHIRNIWKVLHANTLPSLLVDGKIIPNFGGGDNRNERKRKERHSRNGRSGEISRRTRSGRAHHCEEQHGHLESPRGHGEAGGERKREGGGISGREKSI